MKQFFTGREWAELNAGPSPRRAHRPEKEINPRTKAEKTNANRDKVGLVGRPDLHEVHVLMPKNGLGDRVLLEHTGEPVNIGPRLDGTPAEFPDVDPALQRFAKVAEGFARLPR